MKEQPSSFIDIHNHIYTLQEDNTNNNWLQEFNDANFIPQNNSKEVEFIDPFRIAMLAVALVAIPTGQFSLNRFNNERYEIRKSVEDLNLELPSKYVATSENQLETARQWIEQEEERKIEKLEKVNGHPDKGELAMATAVTGWLSLLAMNSKGLFTHLKKR